MYLLIHIRRLKLQIYDILLNYDINALGFFLSHNIQITNNLLLTMAIIYHNTLIQFMVMIKLNVITIM